jgi:FixJ family two-component response regulator
MNDGLEAASSRTNERPTILLVEDDAGVRRSLQMLLQGKGYQVRSFTSATALLADPNINQAACLVADFRLGEMDGLTIQSRMRANGWKGGAILITAFNNPDLTAQAIAEGFTEVIQKPFLEHNLSRAIGRLIGADPRAAAAASAS